MTVLGYMAFGVLALLPAGASVNPAADIAFDVLSPSRWDQKWRDRADAIGLTFGVLVYGACWGLLLGAQA